MNNMPLITVAILSYEQEEKLYMAIDSVCQQDYPFIELLVSDDGSSSFNTAAAVAHIRKYAGKNIVTFKVHHQPENIGTVANSNWVIRHSAGLFLKLLAADDMLIDKSVLSDLMTYFNDDTIQVVAGRGSAKESDGSLRLLPTDIEYVRMQEATPGEMYRLLCTRPWSCILAPAVMFRTSLLREMGGFDENYKYLEDWPFWIKLAGKGISIKMISRLVVQYSLNGISGIGKQSQQQYSVRKAYLQECRYLLMKEYNSLKRCHCWSQAFQCLLSAQCIARRERKLDCFFIGRSEIDRTIIDLPSLAYRKLAGGVGNLKYITIKMLLGIAVGSAACMFLSSWVVYMRIIALVLCLMLLLCGGWNLFIKWLSHVTKRKIK